MLARAAPYARSSGAVDWRDPTEGSACSPAQIATVIANRCPRPSYSRLASENAAGARAGLTRHQQAAARIFIVAARAW